MQPSEFETRERDERRRRVEELDEFADARDVWRAKNRAYYAALERLARFVVHEGASVLEIGCGTGDLLAALKPKDGVGVDLSPRLIEHARRKHPLLHFAACDAEQLDAAILDGRTFDYVILSDVVGMLR